MPGEKSARDGFVSLLLFTSLELGLGLRALHCCWPSGFRPPPASAVARTPCPTCVRPRGSLPSPFGPLDPGPGLSLPGGIPGRCHLGGRCSASPADALHTQGPLAATPTALPQVPICPVKAVRPLEGWHVCQGQALSKVLPLGLRLLCLLWCFLSVLFIKNVPLFLKHTLTSLSAWVHLPVERRVCPL